MRFVFRQWDGSEFPDQAHLDLFSQFLDILMDHGEQAMDALKQMELDPEQRSMIEKWLEDGLLEKVGARFRLTPRAINSLQRKALMEIFRNMRPNSTEGHETPHAGRGGERSDEHRPYEFGDPISDIDVSQTLRQALTRKPGVPVRITEGDLCVQQHQSRATCSTVILLDMSGSMARWHRFASAKRCAMAVYALIRQRFTLDTVDVVGFHSGVEVIPEHRLPLAMPKRVSIFDPEVRIRVPLHTIDKAPQHFTNLHLGLISARRILARRGGTNKQVFIITDGQPTAHVQGEYVHLVYPPEQAAALATLKEAMMLARQGIRFSTFALIEDYFYMDWVGFVEQLTRLTRGVAFYCTGAELAGAVMESFLSGQKKRTFIT